MAMNEKAVCQQNQDANKGAENTGRAKKAMYLKGLCDGMELAQSSKEGKVIVALLDLISELADDIDATNHKLNDLEEYIQEIDEDLGDVEEVLLDLDDEDEDEYEDEDEDEDEDEEDTFCTGNCSACPLECEDDEDDEEEETYFEVVCPSCGDVINFDSSIDPENLRCPNCGEQFECIVDEDDMKAISGDEEAEEEEEEEPDEE